MAETIKALSDALFSKLQKESFVLLSTNDAETGAPNINAISWVYAVTPERIRFALDQRSRIVRNLKANASAILTYIGNGSVHAIYGTVETVAEALEGVPFKLACFDLAIDAVRDAMFYGARITVDPEYEKTYDKRAAEKLDGQVFAAMKKA
jgi:hypothetical protein